MDTTTFNDIFKSNFLEKTGSFSIVDSMIGLLVAFVIGLFIYVIYKKTFAGVMYSHNFNISLIIMTMATTLIIMGISTNVVISLGMVGALSIVRFRTPIKDPMDLVYLFWAIVSGVLCGAGMIPLVTIGAILIGIVMLFFANRLSVENPYLLIVKYDDSSIEGILGDIVAKEAKKHSIKAKSVLPNNNLEITYEIRLKEPNHTAFINDINDLESVRSAVMLSYDGNFTA